MALPNTTELEDFLLDLNEYTQANDGGVSAALARRLRQYADQVRQAVSTHTHGQQPEPCEDTATTTGSSPTLGQRWYLACLYRFFLRRI